MNPTIMRLAAEIASIKARLGVNELPRFLVTAEEWALVSSEHVGGPWFSKMIIQGVPIQQRQMESSPIVDLSTCRCHARFTF